MSTMGCDDDNDNKNEEVQVDPFADVDCTSAAAQDQGTCDYSICELKETYESNPPCTGDCEGFYDCQRNLVTCHEESCPYGTDKLTVESAGVIECEFDATECVLDWMQQQT
jgi:hypothetical protein